VERTPRGESADPGLRGKIVVTVKPFSLLSLKVGNFACTITLAPFILANSSRTIPTHE